MKKINLKDIYPFYEEDCFITINDDVAEFLDESRRAEQTYRRKVFRNKAHYSLDRDASVEHDAIFVSMSAFELYERKVSHSQLHAAIARLPDKQAKRLYACFFLDMSMSDIARTEGVSVTAVSNSISRGMVSLKKELINSGN